MANPDQMNLNLAFGVSLKRVRTKLGLTQEDLAFGSGISLTSIGRMETGTQGVRLETILRIANALEMSGASLVSECEKTLKRAEVHRVQKRR